MFNVWNTPNNGKTKQNWTESKQSKPYPGFVNKEIRYTSKKWKIYYKNQKNKIGEKITSKDTGSNIKGDELLAKIEWKKVMKIFITKECIVGRLHPIFSFYCIVLDLEYFLCVWMCFGYLVLPCLYAKVYAWYQAAVCTIIKESRHFEFSAFFSFLQLFLIELKIPVFMIDFQEPFAHQQ